VDADDIIIMTENEEDIKRTTGKLMEEGEKIEQMVNDEKTKYIVVTRHDYEIRNLEVNSHIFERVSNFKYLGVNIKDNADRHEEIIPRLVAETKCYSGPRTPLQIQLTIVKNENNTVQNSDKIGSAIRLWLMGNNKGG